MIGLKPAIEEIVSQYTVLKPCGKNLRASCPLHAERTPSFFVRPHSQTFRCYGCNASGDVIEFIMRAENLDFKATCERLGIELNPAKKDWKKIRTEQRKKALAQQFNEWCRDRHTELCQLYRTLQKAKDLCQTDEDVERIANYYHRESLWLQELESLESDDTDAKLNLYKEEVMAHAG